MIEMVLRKIFIFDSKDKNPIKSWQKGNRVNHKRREFPKSDN